MSQGNRSALARLLTCIENRDRDLPKIMKLIFAKTGHARVLGITGPPGAGKSTLVNRLTAAFRAQGQSVAVLAVDPSSPFSGGAVLGDRIRMQEHASDSGVFIRSLGTRGTQGGISIATSEMVKCLDAAGFDQIIIETAGVGQTELGILKIAPTIVVVLVPESGDSIQVMKAGLSEISDIFVVNKSDRPESDRMVKDLILDIGLGHDPHTGEAWAPCVVKTVATENKGTADLVEAIEKHRVFLEKQTSLTRRKESIKNELQDILVETLLKKLEKAFTTKPNQKLIDQIIKKSIDMYTAAKRIKL